ncbi:helix-turn-helix domain-containing protein [Rhodococcus ruber]
MSYQAVEWAIKHVPPGLVCVPARAVLVAYAEAADADGRKAYPSIPTISWYLGCTDRNVEKHVKALIETGLLVRSPDQSPAAKIPADKRPVVYDLPIHWVRVDEKPEPKRRGRKPKVAANDPNSSTAADIDPNSSTKRGELQYANDPNSSTNRPVPEFGEPSLEPPVEPPSEPPTTSARVRDADVMDGFDEFWSSYPRKVEKAKARIAWKKAVEKVGKRVVLDGALRYGQDPNLPVDKNYIPHPTTWLNGERWDDEPMSPRLSSTSRPDDPWSSGAAFVNATSGYGNNAPELEAQTSNFYVIDGELA